MKTLRLFAILTVLAAASLALAPKTVTMQDGPPCIPGQICPTK